MPEKASYRLKLLGGQHSLADKSKPVLNEKGEPTGRYERRVVGKDGEFDSPVNLAASEPGRYQLLGATGDPEADAKSSRIAELEAEVARLKAEQAGGFRTPGDPTAEVAATSPSVSPGGQVTTGFQKAAPVRSEPMLPAEAEKHGGQKAAGGPNLDAMTAQQLQEYADQNEIDTRGAKKREDLLRVLRSQK